MAQRKNRAKPTASDPVPIDQATEEAAANPPSPEPEPQAGVLVTKQATPDGGVQVGIQLVGGAQITEVPFLLERGLKVFREQFFD